jgi:hypothetical protein
VAHQDKKKHHRDDDYEEGDDLEEEVALGQWIRKGDHDLEIIADPESGLETFFVTLAVVGLTGCILGGMMLLSENHYPSLIWWIVGSSVTAVVGGVLRWNLDDHYRIDLVDKTIYFQRTFFSHQYKRRVSDLGAIKWVAVDAEDNRRSGPRENTVKVYWTYGIILVLEIGKVLRITPNDVENFDHVMLRAKMLAELLNAPQFPSEKATVYTVRSGPQGPELLPKEPSYVWLVVLAGLAAAILLFFAAIE